MELSRPFIRLPYAFDIERLQYELAQVESDQWMAHPSGLVGNSAVPLISQGGQANNHFVGEMQPTPLLIQLPYMQQVMGSFNEVLARSRLMRLDAGAEVSAHVDFNYHWYSRVRVHVPIVTNPDVTFYCGDDSIHMQAGECWVFDSWRWHNVVNRGGHDRVHLVIDLSGSAAFWDTVASMSEFDPHTLDPSLEDRIEFLAYDSKANPELITERYNVAPVMAPGEMHAIVKELIADFSANAENPADGVSTYTRLLNGLNHDWRSTWLQYGHEEAGWPKFRSLLERTANQLHANPRYLVTQSNNVGVNPIIMQRILRAALNTDQVVRFCS